MAGTGSGLLQPTKLVQTDDFMESIAPPGYKEIYWDLGVSGGSGLNLNNLDSNSGRIYIVPDGLTVEVMDFGFTVADVSAGAAITDITLTVETDTTAVAMTAAATWTHVSDDVGVTKSVGRGTFAWLAAYDTGAERQFGAGKQLVVTATEGGASAGCASFWVRLKYVSKDTGAI